MITVDVGVHHYAMAMWRDDQLSRAEYIDAEPLGDGSVHLKHAILTKDTVVIEIPKVYDAQRQKGDQRDIRDLAMAAGGLAVAARFANGVPGERTQVQLVEPREWKGTVDKKVMLARIWEKLSDEEKKAIRLQEKLITQGIRHGRGPGADVLDAIGIGLWKLGRLKLGRTR